MTSEDDRLAPSEWVRGREQTSGESQGLDMAEGMTDLRA
jgi:hypothetical protein